MANLVTGAAVRLTSLGLRVQTAAKTVPQNATQTVFTVAGGRVFVALLHGRVSTVIAGTTPAAKYIATPTVGTANDMCTALTITSDEAGMMWQLPSAVGSALVGAASTGKSGSVSGNTGGLCGQIVAPGTIGFNVSASDATGAVVHTLIYVPIDDGASVS